MRTFCVVVGAVFFVASSAVQATEPPPRTEGAASLPARIPVDVELRTLAGTPRTEVVTIIVSLYAHKDSTDPLWFEEQMVRADDAGKLTVLAGAATDSGIPAQLFTSAEARWIAIAVKGEPEQPRVMVVSVPYAVKARDTEMVGGRPVSDFVRTDELKKLIREVLTEESSAPRQSRPNAPSGPIAKPASLQPIANIVLPSPAGQFEQLAPTGLTTGLVGRAFSTDGSSLTTGVTGVRGEIVPTNPGGYSAGVRGVNFGTGANGIGVVGYQGGSGWGVYGETPSGIGVYGTSAAGTGVLASHSGVATGTALEVNNGAIKVSGATRTAFTFTGTAQIVYDGSTFPQSGIPIDHPLCNGDPNAIVFVTQLGGFVSGPFSGYFPDDAHPVYIAYVTEISKWCIFNTDGGTLPSSAAFNVLVIKQ
jgi:hypothetical protein